MTARATTTLARARVLALETHMNDRGPLYRIAEPIERGTKALTHGAARARRRLRQLGDRATAPTKARGLSAPAWDLNVDDLGRPMHRSHARRHTERGMTMAEVMGCRLFTSRGRCPGSYTLRHMT